MAKAKSTIPNDGDPSHEEDRSLLSHSHLDQEDADEEDIIVHEGLGEQVAQNGGIRTPRTPRTPNRVRFDLPPTPESDHDGERGPPPAYEDGEENVGPRGQSIPLLTGITAPALEFHTGEPGDEDIHDWAEQERQRPKSGLRSAFMNMANSIIGAGIIGQPYALKQAGLLTGVVLLCGLTVVVDWTIRLIVINSKLSGRDSFQGTVEYCFGRKGLIGISLAQWAFAFGGMVAFGVIVGDSIPHVLRAIWPDLEQVPVLGLLGNRQICTLVFVGGVSWPLSLYRDIAMLAKASTLALISMVVILVTVVVQGVLVSKEDRGTFSTPLLTINTGVFQAIGVISFAFVCHHNSLLIYGSLHTPTLDRFTKVTHYSTFISLIACLTLALSGFLTFTSLTSGNVLNNFSPDNVMVNIARLCFGLNMLTTLPLEAFVCREVIQNYFWPNHTSEPFNLKRHIVISTALVWAALLISLTTCDLGAVFELIGATSACVLAYILPPACWLKLTTKGGWERWAARVCVGFGCVVMGISLVQAVIKMATSNGGTAQCS